MRFASIAAMLVAALAASPVSAHRLSFSDVRRIVSVSNAQISPDGERVAFLRGHADFAKDRTVSDLMLIDVRTRHLRQLTYDRRGLSSPRWSPDGARLAFLMSTTVPGASEPQEEIFVLPTDGGDPRPVTKAAAGVGGFAWSPDGARIAYVSQDSDPHKRLIDEHLDAFEVGSNDYLHTRAAVPSHLWVIGSDGRNARRLTSGPWSLGTVDPEVASEVSWSADGRRIAYTHFPTPIIGDSLGAVIEVVDARTGRRARLTGNSGLEGAAEFAPAGDAIAYSRSVHGDPTNGNAIYVSHGGPGYDVRARIDRDIMAKVWAPDGKSLWLFGQDGTRNAAWYVSTAGGVHVIALGDVAISEAGNAARKTGAIVFSASTPLHPSEIYYLASPAAQPIRLTDENRFMEKIQLGRVAAVRWRNDGFSEDGVLTLPPAYDAQRAYPLVLVIHGGPQSASTQAWSSRNLLFAARGYMVFNPNYRGSTNHGDRYQRAISRDAGAGPGRDVMAGIAAVERTHRVDRSRVAVSGWSYGGYMTSWLEGHYHIWKTAVAGAALNDFFDDYNDAFYVHTDVPWFGGSPWDPRYAPMWLAQSPITYAQSIRTPTLILGDIGDNNVTITNSFKMYHALKDNGVTVQFVAYPVHGHYPSDPVRSEDVTRRWLGWIDRYLRS